ncbi:helix-turn-helix domain-containing protein [Bradyrhizobium yuanmingense]|uniref:Transcriptional regulator with XRE-family HTH domain n=1 Tax=Bradyrhizobium yuanmingense TaxID=108015 RepID=A0ABV4G7J0_9BRAD
MKASKFSDAQKAFILKQGSDGGAVAEICRKAGIDRSYLADLERQSKNPTIDVLNRVAEALGVHLPELFVRLAKRPR